MDHQSTYHQRNALPNRSTSARPLSVSLAEYQPLAFDREALETAYQASLYPSSGASTRVQPSASTSAHTSVDTHNTTPSTLSSDLKPGDNPHIQRNTSGSVERTSSRLSSAGTTNPSNSSQSLLRSSEQRVQQSPLSPIPSVPATVPEYTPPSPTSPCSPSAPDPSSRYGRTSRASHGQGQGYSPRLDMDDLEAAGYETDPGPVVSGHRRQLPPPPTDVPPPVSPS